ncbi:hypothetical protein CI105_02240 [Candidatus Izimaplasma bacterium ZiA1]|uniref:flavodoxin domain-containing protein n=1 Tax=Candidatus Izimoplasma sp. ZiA1 TaxID=2024899 RepID=UPI000BAA6B6E|nr:hypothetical protein CI105_02240 [Candidatus Izimaplasma bacterium ZiA1]
MDLIVYASKKGATRKVAQMIKDNKENIQLVDINEKLPNLNEYENIYIGTPIYIGMINKKIKKLINENLEILLTKKVNIFLVGMNEKELENTIINNFPKSLREKSIIVHVGGAYYFNKLNFFQKLIVKKVANITKTSEAYKLDVINSL